MSQIGRFAVTMSVPLFISLQALRLGGAPHPVILIVEIKSPRDYRGLENIIVVELSPTLLQLL